MKKIYSKLTLIMGLFLLCSSVAIAQPEWNASANVSESTTGITNSPSTTTWYVIKNGDYYLYRNGNNVSLTTNPPTSTTASDWSNYLFCFSDATNTTIKTQSGYYVRYTTGNISWSNSQSTSWTYEDGLFYTKGGYYDKVYIKRTSSYGYNYVTYETNKSNASTWTLYPVTLTIPEPTTYTIVVSPEDLEGAGYSINSGSTAIAGEEPNTIIVTATITNRNVSDFITANSVRNYTSSITVSGKTITITYSKLDPTTIFTFTVTKSAQGGNPGEVSVELKDFSVEEVEVPRQVVINGSTYNVTSIPNHGFTNNANNFPGSIPNCNGSDGNYRTYIDRYNPNLKSVTFEEPCQITSIGTGAFEGCNALTEFVLPYSVKTLGDHVWRGCMAMKTFKFQTNANLETQVTVIPEHSFRFCTGLETIQIPTGVTTIEDEALQYNLALVNITLPNTITTIGTHFLCDAKSLTTFTLPASIKKIAGSAFHGCQSLKSVYLLGSPSALTGNGTFEKNDTYCCSAVTDCTFYTIPDYLDPNGGSNSFVSETNSDSWGKVNNKNGNKYSAAYPGTNRTFTPGQWGTICIPDSHIYQEGRSMKDVFEKGTSLKTSDGFGTKTLLAEMTDAWQDENDRHLYHARFDVISHDDIKANTPYLILPVVDSDYDYNKNNAIDYKLYDKADMSNSTFVNSMAEDYIVKEEANNEPGTYVYMIGRISPLDKLAAEDIYFTSSGASAGNIGTFKFIKDSSITVKLGACRAYWQINRTGVKANVMMSAAKSNNENVDAIKEIDNEPIKIVVEGIYDMNGRKLNVTQEQLPKGMYIMNGKKVLVK